MTERDLIPGEVVTRWVLSENGASRKTQRGRVVKKLRVKYRIEWFLPFGGNYVRDHPRSELQRTGTMSAPDRENGSPGR